MPHYLVQVTIYRDITAEDDRKTDAYAASLAKAMEADPRNVGYLVVKVDGRLEGGEDEPEVQACAVGQA